LTKRFLAVDGTPLGGAHAHAPQLFSPDFHTLTFLAGTRFPGTKRCVYCPPRSVALDELRRTFLSEIRIPATGRAAVGAN